METGEKGDSQMWADCHDPHNRQNKNAGNAGDLVKHTVYLAVIDRLLQADPWRDHLRVRECHAGRGLYPIPSGDRRTRWLKVLCDPVDGENGVLLHDQQRAGQRALRVWPRDLGSLGWYAGSAVLNTQRLAAASGQHRIELYEREPDTRRILALALEKLHADTVEVCVSAEPDGERYIADNIGQWDSRDLVFLDPFAMWRQECHQAQRDRYQEIMDALTKRAQDSALLALFWTWGRNFPAAEGDLHDTNDVVRGGYQDLRRLLHGSGRHFIRIAWRWELQFAMWVLVPKSRQCDIATALGRHCRALRNRLQRDSDIEVTID